MRHLLKYLKFYKKECILGPLFKLLEASFELMIPLVVAKIIDTGVKSGNRGYIVQMCLLMIVLGAVGLLCSVTAQFFAAKAAVGFSTKLRHAAMSHILGFGYAEIDQIGTSTMLTRMTSDINQLQSGVNLTLRLLLRSPFVVFGAMIMAFTIDYGSALIFAVLIPALCLVVFGVMLITMPLYRNIQSKLDFITGTTRENLAGVRVLRAFCKEKDQTAKFDTQVEEFSDQQVKTGRISGLMNPITLVLVNLAVVLLLQTGGLKVESGVLTQGLVIALYNYMSQILVELIKMANLIINMAKAGASARRISSLLSEKTAQKDGCLKTMPDGSVLFKDVTMRYPGASEPSLSHISFTAIPGQTIGIIGGTGSGKTTLVNLISRFYDASDGRVFLGNEDIRSYEIEQLRSAIAVVPQKAELFAGSIRDNLQWGNPDATDDELWQALEMAQGRELVKSREGELDASVSQGGSNFSGGQKQRLTIARALVKKPKILILDDSASALDYATDLRLRQQLGKIQNPPTTFIISQRAASVRGADQILVLDEGCQAGWGTHEELLKTCRVYQEIYESQYERAGVSHE